MGEQGKKEIIPLNGVKGKPTLFGCKFQLRLSRLCSLEGGGGIKSGGGGGDDFLYNIYPCFSFDF